MAEYQKFVFSENYSTAAENLAKIQQKKVDEARQIMADDMEKTKKEAFELGFQEGQKQALEKLKSEMDLHIQTILEKITDLNTYKTDLQKEYEEYSVMCVRHTAKNMFIKSEELFADKLLEQSINKALIDLPMVSQIIIKVPQDAKAYIEDTQIESKIRAKGIEDFKIVEDFSLKSGDCLIEWDKSGILASKQESLQKINSVFNAFLSQEDTELSDNNVITNKEDIIEEIALADTSVEETEEELNNTIVDDEPVDIADNTAKEDSKG